MLGAIFFNEVAAKRLSSFLLPAAAHRFIKIRSDIPLIAGPLNGKRKKSYLCELCAFAVNIKSPMCLCGE